MTDLDPGSQSASTETEFATTEFAKIDAQLSVSPSDAGERLDRYVAANLPGSTRAEAQRLIERGDTESDGVRVNGRREKANYRMRAGDRLSIMRPNAAPSHMTAEAIPLSILFEDSDLLVVDKPRGMVVHPAPGWPGGTLANAVLAHADDLSGIGGEMRPGIVHRLDRDTGGLLMVAKNDEAHRELQRQIQARTVSRLYTALVWGVPTFERATIDAPVGRHPGDRKKMAVITDPHYTSRDAHTELTRLETFSGAFALLEAKLGTGRTHQIRVHCAYINHPIVGDPTYGGVRKIPADRFSTGVRASIDAAVTTLGGQALHAYALSFQHPRTGEPLAFTVPLPPEMESLIALLRSSVS